MISVGHYVIVCTSHTIWDNFDKLMYNSLCLLIFPKHLLPSTQVLSYELVHTFKKRPPKQHAYLLTAVILHSLMIRITSVIKPLLLHQHHIPFLLVCHFFLQRLQLSQLLLLNHLLQSRGYLSSSFLHESSEPLMLAGYEKM